MKLLLTAALLSAPAFAAPPVPVDAPKPAANTGRIFFLDVRGGRVVTAKADGSESKNLIEGHRKGPDGIVIDTAARKIYWTDMGKVKENDGLVERIDLDGSNLTDIVPAGGTFTPKQLKLDAKHGKLYWSDREGMRIMRSNIDGSNVETLIETGHTDQDRLDARNWCVGIAVDVDRGKIYWSQKGNDNAGQGTIRRANLEIPKGQDPGHRKDVEILFDGLPEPIDMDLDLSSRMLYWTDRGDPPRGNTVNRAPMDAPAGSDPKNRTDIKILASGLHEGIGIALDLRGRRMFFTDLGGTVYRANLDGSNKTELLTQQGSLTGIAYADIE